MATRMRSDTARSSLAPLPGELSPPPPTPPSRFVPGLITGRMGAHVTNKGFAWCEETRGIVVSNNFDRARLETDDEDSNFPPTEPASFSARPTASFRPAANAAEQGFWAS